MGRAKFSTVVLKSLWKRGIRSAYTAINTEVDAVCTKMKQFFRKSMEIKIVNSLLFDKNLPVRENLF